MIYKVSTRIETVQDGRRFDEEFRDGAGNSANPAECIFPIFQQNDSGLWKPLGTAFFISSNGFFATAKPAERARRLQSPSMKLEKE